MTGTYWDILKGKWPLLSCRCLSCFAPGVWRTFPVRTGLSPQLPSLGLLSAASICTERLYDMPLTWMQIHHHIGGNLLRSFIASFGSWQVMVRVLCHRTRILGKCHSVMAIVRHCSSTYYADPFHVVTCIRFPSCRSGALQQKFYGSPSCPVLGSPPYSSSWMRAQHILCPITFTQPDDTHLSQIQYCVWECHDCRTHRQCM